MAQTKLKELPEITSSDDEEFFQKLLEVQDNLSWRKSNGQYRPYADDRIITKVKQFYSKNWDKGGESYARMLIRIAKERMSKFMEATDANKATYYGIMYWGDVKMDWFFMLLIVSRYPQLRSELPEEPGRD